MSAQHTPGPLNPDCMRLLSGVEVSPTAIGARMVSLHDCDGYFLFHVTTSIDAIDLGTMLAAYRSRFEAGERIGRENALASLRAFIGVDAAIAKATGEEA